MRFNYKVGVITLAQFLVMSLLSLANSINSIVTTCVHTGSNCVENTIPSVYFFIIASVWFAFIWVLGYITQERHSWRLALILIFAELGIALFALLDAKGHTDLLSLATSLIDVILAAWVIVLSLRLIIAGGGRVVSHQRRRRRPPTVGQ